MIQKAFNSKDLRKKESKLRSKYNRAIKALADLNADFTADWIAKLESEFSNEFKSVLQNYTGSGIQNQETLVFDQVNGLDHLPEGAVEEVATDIPEVATKSGKKK